MILGNINIAYDYQIAKYTSQDIMDIHERILNMINQVLLNNEISINDFELVSEIEKQKLLVNFNSTKTKYDETKTISMVFENK